MLVVASVLTLQYRATWTRAVLFGSKGIDSRSHPRHYQRKLAIGGTSSTWATASCLAPPEENAAYFFETAKNIDKLLATVISPWKKDSSDPRGLWLLDIYRNCSGKLPGISQSRSQGALVGPVSLRLFGADPWDLTHVNQNTRGHSSEMATSHPGRSSGNGQNISISQNLLLLLGTIELPRCGFQG